MRTLSLLSMAAAALLAAACETKSPDPVPAAIIPAVAAPSPPAKVTVISDRAQVCMVNNQFMARPQIPVMVEGRTYYGCCAMCKEKIEKNASLRAATDPITQRSVDKATAIIGMQPNGDVLYFESAETLARYNNG